MSPELQSADNTLAIIRAAGHVVSASDEADYRALFAELADRLESLSHQGTADYMADLMGLMRAILEDHPEWHEAAARISQAYVEIMVETLIGAPERIYH